MRSSRRFLNRPIKLQPSDSAEPFFAPANAKGEKAASEDSFFTPSVSNAPKGTVQTKLTVNAPGDKHEQEADAMANKVVQRMTAPEEEEPIQRATKREEEEPIQRKCADCEKEEQGQVQRKSDGSGTAPNGVSQQIESSKGRGSKLSDDTRTQMESSFGTDFSNVTIHTDSQSAEMNNALHAQAFTHGSDIYFNEGKYNPQNREGGRLLAHELTHVVQQGENIRRNVIANWIKTNITPGSVTNNSPHPIRVWASDFGEGGCVERNFRMVQPNSTLGGIGLDIDHLQDRNGQWYKIGWNDAVVNADGTVSHVQCRVPSCGVECPTTERRTARTFADGSYSDDDGNWHPGYGPKY